MFYEYDDDKYIPLKILLKDMVGYYNDYKDNGKTMNLRLDGDSLDKIYDIFEHIQKKFKIDLSDFTYQSYFEEYLKTKASNETYF